MLDPCLLSGPLDWKNQAGAFSCELPLVLQTPAGATARSLLWPCLQGGLTGAREGIFQSDGSVSSGDGDGQLQREGLCCFSGLHLEAIPW